MDNIEHPEGPTYDELVKLLFRYLAGNMSPINWTVDALHFIVVAPLFGAMLLLGAIALMLGQIAVLPWRALRWMIRDFRKPYRPLTDE